MSKTKILFVHHTTAVGGATNSMLFIIQALDREKFDIEVLFLDKKGPASPLFEKENITIHYLSGITIYQHADNSYLKWLSRKPWLPLTRFFQINPSAAKLDIFFKNHRYDIVHINTSLNLPVGISAKRNGFKVVWHIREPLKKGLLGIRRSFVRKVIVANADKVIAISQQDASKLGPNNKTEVIYNYVDFNRFDRNIDHSAFDKETGLPADTKLVTTLGGTVHSKGSDIFIKAAAKVCSTRSDVMFYIVGYAVKPGMSAGYKLKNYLKKLAGLDYDKGPECQELIKKYHLENRVKFIGLRNDIPQILARTYTLVWPATISHFARPIIEASAMAKPSVATDFPSSREVIDENVNGLFFTKNNANELAEKINYLLDNEGKANAMGENAYQAALQKFNAAHNAEKIVNIYREVVQA